MATKTPLRYRFDLEALVVGLLPSLLRKPKLKAYLNALLMPVATLYAGFVAFQAKARRELSYNGQTLSFQRALNDLFDPVLARIRIISQDASFEAVYVNFVAEEEAEKYTKFTTESPPHFVLYGTVELASQVGFVVRCPASLRPQEPALKARIGQLKLAMVKYRIQYV
jgi:hypothetical protein